MDLELTGKIAVVTGASRGIGLATARALAAEGALVVAGARTVTPELAAIDGVLPVALDLATADGPARLVDAAVEAHGGVDLLVSNLGGAKVRLDGVLAVPDEDWARTFDLNVMSAVRSCRAAVPLMVERGGGSVAVVSSVNSFLFDPAVVDYAAAKAALTNFCSSLAKEYAGRGVRVNVVSPGPTATALWLGGSGVAEQIAARGGASAEEVAAQAAAGIPLGRFSTPEEVGAALTFLLSARSGATTGGNLRIDGGMTPTT